MLTKLITVKNINNKTSRVHRMCFKHIESDLKLCLKIHQVVFKILNSRFMVAFPQSQFKKKNKTQQEKTNTNQQKS